MTWTDGEREYWVGQGIGGPDGPWMALYRRIGSTGSHRLKSPSLPMRETKAEAEADLAAFASRRCGTWKEAKNDD